MNAFKELFTESSPSKSDIEKLAKQNGEWSVTYKASKPNVLTFVFSSNAYAEAFKLDVIKTYPTIIQTVKVNGDRTTLTI